MLDDATIGLAGPETAIGDALGLALKTLANNTAKKNQVIILLTDGANNAGSLLPLASSEIAAKLGIRIYTIGLGADHLKIQTIFGEGQDVNPSRDLDEKTLQKIADMTHGLFFRAKDPNALKTIYQKIDALEPVETDRVIYRPQTELYIWPLGLAWLFLLLNFLRLFHGVFKSPLYTKIFHGKS
jgi:Ca-activated chloride channel family protein